MMINIKDLKNKIIYRAKYRGTKEMDKLLGTFTKLHINELSVDELPLLCDLLDLDDENLYKLNQGLDLTIDIEPNKVTKLFQKYNYVSE
jgi:antitoxin CptB